MNFLEWTLAQTWDMFTQKHTNPMYVGSRRLIHDYKWKIPGGMFFDGTVEMKHAGYDGPGKISNLSRFYYNAEETQRALDVYKAKAISKRKHASIGITTKNNDKGEARQDHCIQSVVIGHYPVPRGQHYTEVDIFYRGTEMPRKFMADLVWFRQIQLAPFQEIFEKYPIHNVTLHFSAVTMHPMFMPVIFPWMKWNHLRGWMTMLKQNDPRLFKYLMGWLHRYWVDYDDSTHRYMQARNTKIQVEKHISPGMIKRIKRYTERNYTK